VSGVTSSKRMSLTTPENPPEIAAPSATTSSGLMPRFGSCRKAPKPMTGWRAISFGLRPISLHLFRNGETQPLYGGFSQTVSPSTIRNKFRNRPCHFHDSAWARRIEVVGSLFGLNVWESSCSPVQPLLRRWRQARLLNVIPRRLKYWITRIHSIFRNIPAQGVSPPWL
jgi:hypothetical protein